MPGEQLRLDLQRRCKAIPEPLLKRREFRSLLRVRNLGTRCENNCASARAAIRHTRDTWDDWSPRSPVSTWETCPRFARKLQSEFRDACTSPTSRMPGFDARGFRVCSCPGTWALRRKRHACEG